MVVLVALFFAANALISCYCEKMISMLLRKNDKYENKAQKVCVHEWPMGRAKIQRLDPIGMVSMNVNG